MDSYRVEAQAALKMTMQDADGALEPIPTGPEGGKGEPDIDKLSNIIKTFNDLFGNIDWKDGDKIRKVIAQEIPARVSQDKAYQNAQAHSDREGARLEHDIALNRVLLELLSELLEEDEPLEELEELDELDDDEEEGFLVGFGVGFAVGFGVGVGSILGRASGE